MIVDSFFINESSLLTIHDCFKINPNNSDSLKSLIIDKYIELYSNESFILKYHESCIKSIKNQYNIINIENVQMVKGYIIPVHPYKKNEEFFNILKNSYHLIK